MSAFDRAWSIIKMPPNLAGETLAGENHPRSVNHYMVHDDVWRDAGLSYTDNVTIDKLEALLGRTLTVDDFTNAPINWSQRMHEEAWWSSEYPHEYQTKINRIGDEGRGMLRDSWIRREIERKKDHLGNLFNTLRGTAGVNLDELDQYLDEKQMSQGEILRLIDYFQDWERDNPEMAEKIREDNIRYRTSWGQPE